MNEYNGIELLEMMNGILPNVYITEQYNDIQNNEDVAKVDSIDLVPIYPIVRATGNLDNFDNVTDADIESLNIGKNVKRLTRGDNFTHAVISLDDTFEKMYSYNKHGFVYENMDTTSVWEKTSDVFVCVCFVEKSEYVKILEYIEYLTTHQSETEYANSNFITQFISSNPTRVDKRFICSGFVGYILAMGDKKNLHRDYSRIRPEDTTILPRAFYMSTFHSRDEFKKSIPMIKSLTKSIYEEHKDELLDYNNHLPKLMLKDQFTKLKTFDKIIDYFMRK